MFHIKHIRVDDRFIHGQILIKWLRYLNIQKVFVIDDEVYSDYIFQSILKNSLPKGMYIEFFSMNCWREYLKNNKNFEDVLVLVKDISTLWNLFLCDVKIEEVTTANLPYKEGKSKLTESIFVSDIEKKIIVILFI